MTVAFLNIQAGGQIISSEDVSIKLFPNKEEALAYFKREYEPDPDYCEAATDEFNEILEALTNEGIWSDYEGQTYIVRKVDE